MSSSPEGGMANGHTSPLVNPGPRIVLDDRQSDSELSDVNETAALQPSDSPSTRHDSSEDANADLDDQEPVESSDNDNNNASDDADFDMRESPAASRAASRHDRSPSHDSRRPTKRKATMDEEDFIAANPELYGLRRSVC